MSVIIEDQKRRPTGLLVLCVMTMVSTAWQLLGSLAGVFSGKLTTEDVTNVQLKYAELIQMLKDLGSEDSIDSILKIQNIQIAILENLQLFSFIGLIIAGVGVFGVYKIYKGFKLGFHLYIVYSFLYLIHYHFIVGASEIPTPLLIANGFISLLLILLYSRHLHWLNKV